MKKQGSILAGLVDPTMERSITRRVIGVLYIVGVLGWTGVVTAGVVYVQIMTDGPFKGVAVVAAPLLWVLGLLVLRIRAERTVVLFRIADHTHPGAAEVPQRRPEFV
jgi:membrane protein DedA with SNARE-associated domain